MNFPEYQNRFVDVQYRVSITVCTYTAPIGKIIRTDHSHVPMDN